MVITEEIFNHPLIQKIKEEHYFTQESLMYVECTATTRNEIEKEYHDYNGCDIVSRPLSTSMDYEGNSIIGYSFYDKYQYYYDNGHKGKRHAIQLYYNVNIIDDVDI